MAVSFQRGCHKVNRILEPRSQFPHSASKSDPLQDASMYSNEQTKNCVIGCDTRCGPTWAHTYIKHRIWWYTVFITSTLSPTTCNCTRHGKVLAFRRLSETWLVAIRGAKEITMALWGTFGERFLAKALGFFPLSQCGFGPDFWSYFIDGLCFML